MDDLIARLRDVLQPDYELEGEVGHGGMSRVFAARDARLGRRVAVKVLAPELTASLSVERFEREIVLAAALQHPNIVPVLTAGQVDGLPYYIMPFVEGESVRDRLTRGPFSIREAVSVLRDVARALAYAHSTDVVHRDIKPDNILQSAGAATVTDFGLAKAVTSARGTVSTESSRRASITRVGTSIGTPAYMAPEQAAGDPALDHRADLYSLGIVAYEMLAGVPPFTGKTPQQLLAAQLTERPESIAKRRYDVPVALRDIIDQLLQKDPAKRPKSATELVRMLDRPDTVSGTFAVPPSSGSTGRPTAWVAAGIAIVAIAGAVFWFLR